MNNPNFTPIADFLASKARWDLHFMEDAHHASRKSKDKSTRCGCVIVNGRHTDLVRGWNGFPRGVNDDVAGRHERPTKYQWTEHAERNAIFNAACEGIALRGCTLYATLMPCCDCARAIIQAGIVRVVTYEPDWADPRSSATFHWDVSMQMFAEAGVSVDFLAAEDPGDQADLFR